MESLAQTCRSFTAAYLCLKGPASGETSIIGFVVVVFVVLIVLVKRRTVLPDPRAWSLNSTD